MGTAQEKDTEIYNITSTKTITVPAIGAEISYAVPAGKFWKVVAIVATLTTSATVNNRVPTLKFTDGTNEIYRNIGRTNIPASQAVKCQGAQFPVLPADVANSLEYYIIPYNFVLGPGYVISSITTGLDTTAITGDAYTAIFAIVYEYDTTTQ